MVYAHESPTLCLEMDEQSRVLMYRVYIMGQQEMHPQGLENASYFWLAVTVPVCSGLTFASILTKQQSLLF